MNTIRTIFALVSIPWVIAAPGPEPAANNAAGRGSVCTKAPYNLILPFSTYGPALTFCSAKYPIATVTSTTTMTPMTTTTMTVTQTVVSKKKRDNKSASWKKCTSSLHGNFLSTACSCIETPVTTILTQTGPTSTVTATTTVAPAEPTDPCNQVDNACDDNQGRCFNGRCGQRFTDPNAKTTPQVRTDLTDVYSCWDYCTGDLNCQGSNFDWRLNVCTFYNSAAGPCNHDGCALVVDSAYDGFISLN